MFGQQTKIIKMQIHTYDRDLVFDLLGRSSISKGNEVKITDQAKLIYEESVLRKNTGFPEIVNITLNVGKGVAIGIVASWLYNKLKGKKIEKLTFEKTEIEVDEGQIQKVIKEKIEIEKE